jgi:hypothetical protein
MTKIGGEYVWENEEINNVGGIYITCNVQG